MAKTKQTVTVDDYEHDEINKIAIVLTGLERMTADERFRALRYIKSKYPKEWPSDEFWRHDHR